MFGGGLSGGRSPGTRSLGVVTDRRAQQLDRVAGWLALLAVAVPFVVNVVVAAGLDWHPVSDRAVIVARVADVFGGDTPLVGAYSRFGFNHPGPLGAHVLAPAWALRPQAGTVLAAAALVNGVAAVVAVAVVRRRAGTLPALGLAAVVLVLVRALGPDLLRDPWNPWLPLMPFLLFVVAVWAMATGSRWSLPLAVGAGSFVVQEHVGYVPVVAALGAWGVVALALEVVAEHRRAGAPTDEHSDAGDDDGPWWLRGLVLAVVTAVVVGAAWAAPLRQQAAAPAGTGNLSLLVAHLRDDAPSDRPGLQTTLGIVGREAAPWGPWIGGDEPSYGFTGGVVPAGAGGLVALVSALGVALALRSWRRGPDVAVRWVATALVGVGAGVLAVARIDDGVFPYLIRWWWVLAAVGWFGVVWVLAGAAREVVARRWPGAPVGAAATTVLLAAVVVLSGIATAAATSQRVPDERYDRALAALEGPVLDAVPAGAPVSVAAAGTDVGIVAGGLGWALEQAGRPLATGPGTGYIWGDVRADRPEPPPGRRLVVRAAQEQAGPVELPVGDEVLATYDALDPAERAEVQRLQSEVDEALRAAQAGGALRWDDAVDPTRVGVPAADVARLRELLARSYQVTVSRPAGAPG